MRVAIFYLKQTVLLGTIGYGLFVFVAVAYAGPFLVSGAWLMEWLFALALAAAFSLFLVTPLQLLFRRLSNGWPSISAGVLAGPVAVVIALLVLRTPKSFHLYVTDALLLHLLLASLGVLFAFNFHRWLGHNKRLNAIAPNDGAPH
jgi:hypothetical protein